MDDPNNKNNNRDGSSTVDVESVDIIEDNQSNELEKPEDTGSIRNPDGTFKKGRSGNPAGKPKGSVSITEAIRRKLEEEYFNIKNPEEKKTYLEKIIETIFHNALEAKDARTLKDIWSYIDGQPKATLDIGADKEGLAELTEFFREAAKNKNDS